MYSCHHDSEYCPLPSVLRVDFSPAWTLLGPGGAVTLRFFTAVKSPFYHGQTQYANASIHFTNFLNLGAPAEPCRQISGTSSAEQAILTHNLFTISFHTGVPGGFAD